MKPTLALALASLIGATALQAQEHEHRGFWIGFGLGAGQNLSKGLDGGSLTGGGGYLRLGGTPKQNLLFGMDAIGWSNDDRNRGNVTASVTWYPSRQGGFLKGGVGIATIGRTTTSGNTTTTTTVGGLGLTFGGGVEVKLGRNIYLVPGIDLITQFFSEQTDPVLGQIPGRNVILVGTVGLLWH